MHLGLGGTVGLSSTEPALQRVFVTSDEMKH